MSDIKISYAITVCNENEEVMRLVNFLLNKKRIKDEIVILYDHKNGDEEIATALKEFNKLPNVQFWRGLDFDGHFANWKNKLSEYCTGDYIFQIDADEFPPTPLMEQLPFILRNNPSVDAYQIPRINTVTGLTQEHINKWRWNVNEKGWVNWPDYQWRIWKNIPEIKWKNRVHEVLEGYKTFGTLPQNGDYALKHFKGIERQEKQNEFYQTLS